MSNLHYYLFTGHHIFDFATQYATKHDTIAPAHEFVLTDADYNDFKEFIQNRDFKYDKMSGKILDDLRNAMTFEGYMDETSTQLINNLSQLLEHNIYRDLDTFRREIERSLTQEIVQRYYYQRGNVIIGLRNEPVTDAAIKILLSPQAYQEILSPKK